MSFTNKTVIITGAASGLGKAIATAFANASANVVFFDLNQTRLVAAVTELQSTKPTGQITTIEGSITSSESITAAITAAKKVGKDRLDILVNCAGIMDNMSPAGDCTPEIWDRVISVNLTGTFLTTHHAINTFLAQSPPGGVILNIGSTGSVKGGVSGAAYTASKHGILGLTKNTAAFYAKKGIRCNAVMPGGMATGIAESAPGEMAGFKAENYEVVMSNMAMQPEMCDVADVARLVVSMCGEEGRILNGACVAADNGWLAN